MTAPTEPGVLALTGDWDADLADLRGSGPIIRVWLPGEHEAWVVTDPDCIRAVSTDPRIVKNPRNWPALSQGRIGTDNWILPWVAMDSAFTNDGSAHTHLRNLLRPAFTAPASTVQRASIGSITNEVLDALAATGPGQVVDLRTGFTDVIPIRIICEIMGMPVDLAARLCACTGASFDFALTREQARAGFGRLALVLDDVLSYKRAHRGLDLTSTLLTAHENGQLSERQLRDSITLILAAGYETVATLLDHAIVELLTPTLVRKRLVTGELTWRAVVEETLRMWPPLRITPTPRFPLEAVEIGGVLLAPGELVFLSYGAAGRDRAAYPDPDTFDPARAQRVANLAFGHGRHYCIGESLARAQAEIALSRLHTRFPAMELAVPSSELEKRPSLIVGGHRRLPVLLGASGRADAVTRA
ncbi:cytochrome P450 [Nocardia takedensis]